MRTPAAPSASCGVSPPSRPSPRRKRVRPTDSSRASSRPTCRRRPPASFAGSTTTAASSTTGSSPRDGRSSPSSTSGRCSTATGDRALVETRELAADDWVVIPAGVAHGFLALEPLELLYLVTNEFDESRRAGLRLGRPGRRRSVAACRGHPGRPADPVGPRPIEPDPRGPGDQPPRLRVPPHQAASAQIGRTCPHRSPQFRTCPVPDGAIRAGTIPRLSGARPGTTLAEHSFDLRRPLGSSRCANPSSPSSSPWSPCSAPYTPSLPPRRARPRS